MYCNPAVAQVSAPPPAPSLHCPPCLAHPPHSASVLCGPLLSAQGSVSVGLTLIHALVAAFKPSLADKWAPLLSTVLVCLWIPGAGVTTFRGPFLMTGNGAYVGCPASRAPRMDLGAPAKSLPSLQRRAFFGSYATLRWPQRCMLTTVLMPRVGLSHVVVDVRGLPAGSRIPSCLVPACVRACAQATSPAGSRSSPR